jgi:hypothetical protein
MLSEHKNISNLEVIPDFINCIYSLIRKNNKNKEVLEHTIKTLLNFDTKKDNNYIIINRIQIIIDVMKNNIILDSENKTIVLNLCTIIKNNYKFLTKCAHNEIFVLNTYENGI